jgi:superfamily II DNA or RNA helicase
MQPRPYQVEQLNASLTEYINGVNRQLLVAATGTGKTPFFCLLYDKVRHLLPGKMLVTVHREKLVDQAIKAMHRWNPTLKIGKEMAEHYADTDCDVIVSCIASVGRDGATRMQRFGWDNIDKIVVDEAHHSIADSYLRLLAEAGVLQPGSKKLLVGVTATPKRKNRRSKDVKEVHEDEDMVSLKTVFQKIIHKYTIRQAIKDGWLVPIRGFRLKTETDLSDIKTVAGDYNQGQLAEAVNTGTRNQQIVKMWLDVAERRQTLVFTVDIQHGKDLAAEFRKAGIKAEAVWGTDKEQEEKIAQFERGEITVLCNCALLTEGFDAWQIQCVLDAAPTQSSSLYTQKIGRGTRLEEGTGNLLEALKGGMPLHKQDCLVIDVCDNNKRCSLVTLPSLVGLNPDFNLHGESVTKAADKVEELEEKHPGIDFKDLTDLSKVKAYVEALDLFADPYPVEVKEFSELTWLSQADGSYVLHIPEERGISDAKEYWRFRHERLVITQDNLEQWELSIVSTDPERKLGTFNTLKEAITTSEEVVRRCRGDRVKLLQREASWHQYPATDATKRYLKRLVGKTRPFMFCLCPVGPMCSGVAGQTCATCGKPQLTAGQATTAITKLKVC